MSIVLIRAALETALNGMSPALATEWQNEAFTPPALTAPYQSAYLLPAEPDNREIGPQHVQRGIFQISLRYPQSGGTGLAETRAELIRTTFARGVSFTSGGVTVTIEKTPEIAPAQQDGDRLNLPVRVRFYAPVNT